MLLAVSGLSVAACSDNSNSGFPSTTKNDAATGDDDDDDDDDDASSPTDAGAKKDATTGGDSGGGSTDSGTGSDATTAPGVKSADIYQCGAPSDCTGGQNCYITAYSDWDGGNFYNSKCGPHRRQRWQPLQGADRGGHVGHRGLRGAR